MEGSLEGDAKKLLRTAVDMALREDTVALRICMDRLMPPGKDRRATSIFLKSVDSTTCCWE
jgi:hypothetical protein